MTLRKDGFGMAVSENKGRVVVTLSKQMIAAVDDYCSTVGMSRSQYIAGVIGQNLYALNKVTGLAGDVLQGALESEFAKDK